MAFCHIKILCSFYTNLARLWRLNDISIFKKKQEKQVIFDQISLFVVRDALGKRKKRWHLYITPLIS
jgi:hypothetical protein